MWICVSPWREHTSKALMYGTRSQGISQFYLHTRVHPLTEWTILAFAFPAEAGTHLPTPEGWKAELALGGWLVTYRNKCPAPGMNADTLIMCPESLTDNFPRYFYPQMLQDISSHDNSRIFCSEHFPLALPRTLSHRQFIPRTSSPS